MRNRGEVAFLFRPQRLSCSACHFAGATLRMPAVARNRRLIADALAIVAAILAARRHRTIATRMRTFLNFLLCHRAPLRCFPCGRAYAHPHPKSILTQPETPEHLGGLV